MASYTEEEKIKILYEQSLKEIRDVVARIESVAGTVAATSRTLKEYEADAHTKSATALAQASNQIQEAVRQLVGIEGGMQNAAAGAARDLLLGDNAPLPLLERLVRRQHEALSWLNRAAERYSNGFWLAGAVGMSAGVIGGLIVRYL